MSMMSELMEHWNDPARPIDWYTNPWGWPCVFGLGDEAAHHPIDSEHDMIWIVPANTVVVWNERLQMEYSECAR